MGKWFVRSISKVTRSKRTRGVAQTIEHLLCQCEALNSNPNATKKKKKRKEKKKVSSRGPSLAV
jgi:hypothetical protein